MNTATIANITRKDFEHKQIRILAAQKELFADETRGFPQTCDINMIWQGHTYHCSYRIGSKDERGCSWVLRLKDGLAENLGDLVRKTLEMKDERVKR